jgi:hypothetical protein
VSNTPPTHLVQERLWVEYALRQPEPLLPKLRSVSIGELVHLGRFTPRQPTRTIPHLKISLDWILQRSYRSSAKLGFHNSLGRIPSDHDLSTPFPPPVDNLVRPVRLPTVRRLVHPSLIPLNLRRLAQSDGFTRLDQVMRQEGSRRVGVFEEGLDLRV